MVSPSLSLPGPPTLPHCSLFRPLLHRLLTSPPHHPRPQPSKGDAMHLPSLSCLPVLLLAFCLLLAQSPADALSIPPNLKAPPRIKSLRSRAPEKWTNAQRLAAGLPPRAPRTFKRATSTAPNPFAANPVKRTAPSPSPSPFANARTAVPTSYSGRIVARHPGSDRAVGYLRASSSGVNLGSSDASTTVTFTTTGGNALFSVDNAVTSDTEASSTPEAIIIGASGTAALGAGSANAVTLGNVQQTAPHSRPALTGGESAIWTFDAATQAFTGASSAATLAPPKADNTDRGSAAPVSAHWVNPDGSHPRTHVAYSARDGALLLTGDVDAYNEAHPDDALSEVTLYLESA
ncbi:hypothetical protein BN946_scf184697.g2 [Trametes cinnabarina]|uniref:Uncharacterized protein n=1 Tax=Pycnoporus cinnabarinus TaxID=5643 RepID=A0A060S5U8_PYCCI|nr:hypothetical protein BN946_scf184697.g2 [Trametes cinnabarina]